MSTTHYEILPATRTWDMAAERIANKLAGGADGLDRDQVAAVGLLMRLGPDVWMRREISAHFNVDWRAASASRTTGAYVVYWAGLAHAVRHLQTISASDRAAILLACSLADGQVIVHLGQCLRVLTEQAREAFVEAMRYAGPGR